MLEGLIEAEAQEPNDEPDEAELEPADGGERGRQHDAGASTDRVGGTPAGPDAVAPDEGGETRRTKSAAPRIRMRMALDQ